MTVRTVGNETTAGRPDSLRRRVLLLAYACSPYVGSEGGVGWHRVVETGKYFDTWVICGKREFEVDIIRYLKAHGELPGVHFCFIPRTRMEKWIWKMPGGVYIGYNSWHKRAYLTAVNLHRKYNFDLVLQVNWTGFREPGYLWKLGIPFVWGPVGGTQNIPLRFLMQSGLAGAIKEGTRTVLNWLQLRFSPRVRHAAKTAAILLTSNSTGFKDFQRVHNVKPRLLLETGVTSIKYKVSINRNLGNPLKILWSGELRYHKAFPLLLRALSKMPPQYAYALKILGRGPLEQKWRGLSRQLGVEPFCEWVGWLPHADALREYEWADVLVFTSMRDTSGNVILEALGHGVPVICYDHQGAGDIINDSCGVKIPVATPNKMVADLTHAIEILIKDRATLEALSRGAAERAKEYLWSNIGAQLAQLYNQILVPELPQKVT
jgi:glycosyltransferase involved in cell wall biosynthesis